MDTPELDDQRLDSLISHALNYEITITSSQKQQAWERLRAAAAEQIRTTSLDDPCECGCPDEWQAEGTAQEKFTRLALMIGRRWRGVSNWIWLTIQQVPAWFTDDDRYRRAQLSRATLPIPGGSLYCYNTQLRFAFSMFQH